MHHVHNLFGALKSFRLLQVASVSVLAFASVSAQALPSDRNQPIQIDAQNADYTSRPGVVTLTGNVTIQQGTMRLQANTIVAQLSSSGELQTATATGSPTRFQQQISAEKGLARGEAQRIIYNADTGIITLTGNAFLNQDGASIRGDTLRYSMNRGDIEAKSSSNGRVQMVIPPSSSRSFPGARD